MPDDPALAIAVSLIKQFEGLRLSPYPDPTGVWTIGYGMTYLSNGVKVTTATPTITAAIAEEWLTSGVAKHVRAVRNMINPKIQVSDNAVAAMTSFSWNEGTSGLRNSPIMLAVNTGNMQEAAQDFRRYVYAGGRVSDGLLNRRKQEEALFLTPDQPTADELNAAELERLNETD